MFNISTNGALTTLYSFDPNGSNGVCPQAALVQGYDGYFYGMTPDVGIQPGDGRIGPADVISGTVFKMSTNGTLTTLYAFGSITIADGDALDGANPNGLVQGSDGRFYGTTYGGGASGAGTVLRLTIVPEF